MIFFQITIFPSLVWRGGKIGMYEKS